MLELDTHWVWDSWSADDGPDHHVFYLKAPRSLGDPELRHHHPAIGHSVSVDHRTWRHLPDALSPGAPGTWDDMTTWTGSIVRGPERWHLFYTGGTRSEGAKVQRIGRADSDDLITWTRYGSGPVCEADQRWYEKLGDPAWPEEAWRDPWVFPDPGGDGWHMLVTARSSSGPGPTRGVVGHARSADLDTWVVRPPLTAPAGFGHIEVVQIVRIDGRFVMVFSCPDTLLDATQAAKATTGTGTGTWSAPAASPLGPYDMQAAMPFADGGLYAARLVDTGPGGWALLGFREKVDNGTDGFGGFLEDPVPVALSPGGTLVPRG